MAKDLNVGGAALDLAQLIDPIDPREFKRDYWEHSPLIIRRREPSFYHGLLTLADVDAVLSSPVRAPHLRVLREGAEINVDSPSQVASAEAVYEQFRNGCTIALHFLHERIPTLAQLCRSLAGELSAACQVNAYLTPPGEKGLATHYDTHDVFILQIAGTKHWRLFEETVHLPLEGQRMRPRTEPQTDPTAEFDLLAGDALHLPRGFAHDAAAVDSISLHLTVGVRPVTWAFVILTAVEAAIEQDPRFRESLPLGFAADMGIRRAVESNLPVLLDTLRKQVDAEQVIDNAVTAARNRTAPVLDGHLLDLEAVPRLQLETRVRHRPGVSLTLTAEGEKVELSLNGKTLRMPHFVTADLEFISHADEFTARDLPGDLNESGRLVLVKRLVREGILTVGEPGRV